MNIHEYQAKELLRKKGLPVPVGKAALSVDEADSAAAWVRGETKTSTPPLKARSGVHQVALA